MDVIKNRHLTSKIRTALDYIPGGVGIYALYWRMRAALEALRSYQPVHEVLPEFKSGIEPTLEQPTSQLCTAGQCMSPAYYRWCKEMRSPARFSRKQWEFAYILEVLWQAGQMRTDKKGLGFGCGQEPLAAIFAKHGATVLATDLAPEEAEQKGWVRTLQHSASLENLYKASRNKISRKDFFSKVSFRSVDMNAIPDDLDSFDFVWSACAFEHLGSLRHGMEFIKNSSRLLKPGGIAVHTTEFNLSSNQETMEHPGCSVFRKQDMERLAEELVHEGYVVEPFNFNCGNGLVDNHVDAPPYGMSPHLKLKLDQYVVTSIGIIVRKPDNQGNL